MSKLVEDTQILAAIAELTTSAGYPPTIREMGRRLGLSSSSTIHHRLTALRTKGFVMAGADDSGQVRTRLLRLTQAGYERIGFPCPPRSAGRRQQFLPVLHSSAALIRFLETPSYRETVASSRALASCKAEIIPVAALRSLATARFSE